MQNKSENMAENGAKIFAMTKCLKINITIKLEAWKLVGSYLELCFVSCRFLCFEILSSFNAKSQ